MGARIGFEVLSEYLLYGTFHVRSSFLFYRVGLTNFPSVSWLVQRQAQLRSKLAGFLEQKA
jgi:hypothetical protein